MSLEVDDDVAGAVDMGTLFGRMTIVGLALLINAGLRSVRHRSGYTRRYTGSCVNPSFYREIDLTVSLNGLPNPSEADVSGNVSFGSSTARSTAA